MLESFFAECHTREAFDDTCRTYSLNVMHGKHLITSTTLNNTIEKNRRRKNEIKAANIIQSEQFALKNTQEIERIYSDAMTVIRALSEGINGKVNADDYRTIRSLAEKERSEIDDLEERIAMRKHNLRKQKAKYSRIAEFIRENRAEMKMKYEASAHRKQMLQQRTKQIFQGLDDDMKHMVACANNTLRELDKQVKDCRDIVTVFGICQKSMSMQERLHCNADVGRTSIDGGGDTDLDAFWREVGIIKSTVSVLDKEFHRLQQENTIVQNKIRRYMSERKNAKFGL